MIQVVLLVIFSLHLLAEILMMINYTLIDLGQLLEIQESRIINYNNLVIIKKLVRYLFSVRLQSLFKSMLYQRSQKRI